jgi:hypothetical protein
MTKGYICKTKEQVERSARLITGKDIDIERKGLCDLYLSAYGRVVICESRYAKRRIYISALKDIFRYSDIQARPIDLKSAELL